MRFDEYRRHDATALGRLVTNGEVGAEEVLETAIARAEAGEPRHQRHRPQAVRAGPPRRGRRPRRRPAERRAFPHQGPRLLRDRRARHLRQQPVCRFRRRSRQRLRAPLQGRGSRLHGPQLEPRVRPEPQHRAAPLRLLPQSLEPRAFGRRVVGRRRGGRHCRHPADGACHRRRRLDPHPRGPVRPLRAQADAWPHLNGAGCGRGLGRALGRSRRQPQRARLGPHARRGRGPRARRPLRLANAGAPLRRGDRPPAGTAQDRPDARRSSWREAASGMPESGRRRGQAVPGPRPHRRGGRPRPRPRGAAADECHHRRRQHGPRAGRALEGPRPRAQCARTSRPSPGPSTIAD